MYSFSIDCPNKGLGEVISVLQTEGIRTDSRNGPVVRFPKPVCLEYENPRRRLLTSSIRDANHFFHLFETLWMLAGLDTVAPLDLYNSGMKQYSDDGIKFAAPYGYRLRKRWGDQMAAAIQKLKDNPEDRRIVLQIWDPKELFKGEGKDFACNQQMLLDTRPLGEGFKGGYALDMTVTNRSNDLIYGAMGSNLFHFSFMHEWLANQAGLALGTYYQISKNMHLYLENPTSKLCWDKWQELGKEESPEQDVTMSSFALPESMSPFRAFVEQDLRTQGDDDLGYLGLIAKPVCEAYRVYKIKHRTGIGVPMEARIPFALEVLQACRSPALRRACEEWFQRRWENHKKKMEGTP